MLLSRPLKHQFDPEVWAKRHRANDRQAGDQRHHSFGNQQIVNVTVAVVQFACEIMCVAYRRVQCVSEARSYHLSWGHIEIPIQDKRVLATSRESREGTENFPVYTASVVGREEQKVAALEFDLLPRKLVAGGLP